jgi:hypothetical protein
MFDIGLPELLVIIVIDLIGFGPIEEIRGVMPNENVLVDLAEAVSTFAEDTAGAPKVTGVSEKALKSEREKEEASSSVEKGAMLCFRPQKLICLSSAKHMLKWKGRSIFNPARFCALSGEGGCQEST